MRGDRFKLKFDSPHPHTGGGRGGGGGGWRRGGKKKGGSISLIHRDAGFSFTAFYVGKKIPAGNFFQRRTDSIIQAVACFLLFHLHNTGLTHLTNNNK